MDGLTTRSSLTSLKGMYLMATCKTTKKKKEDKTKNHIEYLVRMSECFSACEGVFVTTYRKGVWFAEATVYRAKASSTNRLALMVFLFKIIWKHQKFFSFVRVIFAFYFKWNKSCKSNNFVSHRICLPLLVFAEEDISKILSSWEGKLPPPLSGVTETCFPSLNSLTLNISTSTRVGNKV